MVEFIVLEIPVSDDIYVGSTTQPLSKRFQKHKENINNKRDGNMLIYQKMRNRKTTLLH